MDGTIMRKIYTKCVFIFNKKIGQYERDEGQSEFYYISNDAPIAHCGGGGKGGGGGGGGSQSTQTIQKADPWSGQQPYLHTGFMRAQEEFLGKTPSFFPGSIITPFSPETQQAMQMQTNRALTGSPIQQEGTNQLTDTLAGDYLGQMGNLYNNPIQQMVNTDLVAPTLRGDYLFGNPGFNEAYDAAARKIIPQVDSAFERSGRTGSGLAQQAKTQALSDAFASQYAQERSNQMQAASLGQQGTGTFLDNIGRERDNQIRSMMFAPQMASLDYQDIGKLAEVGAQKEALDQQKISEDIARFDYNQNSKAVQLAKYMNLVQGNYGGESYGQTTADVSGGGSSSFSPNIMGGLGGMLMSSSLGVNPMMGLLSGLF
jgi:hypothetical protein